MSTGEAVVRIRLWENSDEYRDEYYTVPAELIPEIRTLITRDRHNTAVRAFVGHRGRKLEPQVTIEIDAF